MASTNGYVQIAMEESPIFEGVGPASPYSTSATVAYLPLQTARVMPQPQNIDRSDEQRGIEGSVAQLLDHFEPEGNITMRMYPKALTWLLNCSGFKGAVTAGAVSGVVDPDGTLVTVGANKWVFTKRGGLTARTMAMIVSYFESGVFMQGNGFGVSGLSLSAEGAMSADLMGLYVKRISDPALTAAYPSQALKPFRKADMRLTWLGGSGEPDDFSLAIANPLVRHQSMGTATHSYFPDKLYHDNARVAVTGSIPMYTLTTADVDAMLSVPTFSATAKWISDVTIGASTTTYKLFVEMPSCQVITGQPDEAANVRRYGSSLDWFAAYDESAGYDVKITLINADTTLGGALFL